MKNFMQLTFTLLFLIIFLGAPGMKMVQGQQICKARSINFTALCLRWSKCKQACLTENFPDGRCIARRCFCMTPCHFLT
ncbi:hypothetical protein EUTSA_v10017555mg [Eutrema salsugineum]|uniref:Knottins-like domain-containing protein n=1 Tax=Eutrema salsugineum TaxID=72664 RepID=V4MFC1_EUTSA|nr:hypothetical protein EUTSA_v10017555mg [Eutrema salsugineum]